MAKIVVDAGHGQGDNVGVGSYREGTQMWYLAQYLQQELVKRGHTVVNTRPLITNQPSLSSRGAMANGFDIFMSIHSNANSNPAIRGAIIYDSVADAVDNMETELVSVISKTMNTLNKGVTGRESNVTPDTDYYGVLRSAVRVGCNNAMLIEHGYHTNPEDANWLMSHDNLRKLAIAEADVITKYYPSDMENNMIKLGSRGIEVEEWQHNLNKQGYNLVADGIFGSKTEIATKDFQAKYGLTADGIVGEKTYAKMADILAPVPPPPTVDYKSELEKAIAKINLLNVEIQNLKNQVIGLEKTSQTRHDELTQVAMAFEVLSGVAERY